MTRPNGRKAIFSNAFSSRSPISLEASGALERISRRIEPYMGWLGLSGKAGFPLMAGLVFGRR